MNRWGKPGLLARPALWIGLVLILVVTATVNWPGSIGGPRIAAAANTVTVELADVGDSGGITFQPGVVTFEPSSCNVMIRVGDICTDLVSVQNTGIAFTYTISAWVDTNGTDDGEAGPAGDVLDTCFNVSLVTSGTPSGPVGDGSSQGPLGPFPLISGTQAGWRLDATVDDDNACQERTGIVFLHVSAMGIESTPTPTATATNTPVISTSTPIPNVVPTEIPSTTPIPSVVPTDVPSPTTVVLTETAIPPASTSLPLSATALPSTQAPLTQQVLGQVTTPTPTAPAVPPSEPPTSTPIVLPAVAPVVPTVVQEPPAKVEFRTPENFLGGVPGLSSISTDVETVARNLILALIALLALLVASTMFNATLEENAEEIDVVFKRMAGSVQGLPVAGVLGWMSPDDTRQSFWQSLLKPALIALLSASIYAALEPDFGLNSGTLVLIVALLAGISVTTFVFEGGIVLMSTRRYGAPAAMRIYPIAILIAIGCVGLAKLTDLHPGIIFGFVSAAVVAPRTAMTRRDRGIIVLVPLVSLMLIALASFLLIDPLREFSNDNPGVWGTLPETIAVALFVGGANSALLILLPVKFNDGQVIWAWNKLAWLALAGPAAFGFFHVILHDESLDALSTESNQVRLLGLCLGVLLVSTVTWGYFWLRRRGEEGM